MINYIKLYRLNKKYKGANILTSRIHPDVKLSKKVSITHGCSLGSGVQIDAYTYINSYTEVSSGLIGNSAQLPGFA